MSAKAPPAAPSTRTWLALLALTVVTVATGASALPPPVLASVSIVLAMLKCALVTERFMELHRVRGIWRPLLLGYIAVVGAGVIATFWLNR